jgi:hypothetical protein
MPRKKRKTKREKQNAHYLLYVIWGLSALIISGALFIAGYYTGYAHAKQRQVEPKSVEHIQKVPLLKQEKVSVKEQLKKVLQDELKPDNTASHEIDDEALANPPKIIPPLHPIKKQTYTKRPKLAIVIDDVQTASHIRAIKNLGLVLTMSFLPPRAARPNSAKLASLEPFYMVHLPLEAMHFNSAEPHTLCITDSQEKILKRIQQIKKLFPRVHYINNHTGSKFTSNEQAMFKLISALRQNDILFVDSRTIGNTKAPKVLKHFGMKYVSRDIFLDHHPDKAYIKNQIKKAIALAKKRGHAIAIGHPHKATLQALYESKELLKQVDLVQINQIY